MPSRVFVTNGNSSHNYHSAQKYGEVTYLTTGTVNMYHPGRMLSQMQSKLKDFSEQDCLLLSGNTLCCALAILALQRKNKKLNLLIFDAVSTEYLLHQVDTEQAQLTHVGLKHLPRKSAH